MAEGLRKITFERVYPTTGGRFYREECFRYSNGNVTPVYFDSEGKEYMATYTYSGFQSVEGYIAYWNSMREKDYLSFVEKENDRVKTEADLKEYKEKYRDKISNALAGLSSEDDILRLCDTAVEYYDAIDCIRELPYANPKEVRKALKEAMSQARATAREEFPEDYREADDKEEFYGEYEDELADYLAQALRG